ncbi:MAG: CrcB family protein [Chloroflexi bacterium]|nr:CrcB family protein [Chloroflexota bacterium]MDA1228468.1 CrcB family protein [Chloroflexota bacterium]
MILGLTPWVLVALGGALGAVSRYGIDRVMVSFMGPTVIGTFAVNITGSFLLGLFLTLSDERFGWSPELRVLVAVGFLGSYTTFSTLTVASLQLAGSGEWSRATVNIVASLVIGLAAAFLGIAAGRAL